MEHEDALFFAKSIIALVEAKRGKKMDNLMRYCQQTLAEIMRP